LHGCAGNTHHTPKVTGKRQIGLGEPILTSLDPNFVQIGPVLAIFDFRNSPSTKPTVRQNPEILTRPILEGFWPTMAQNVGIDELLNIGLAGTGRNVLPAETTPDQFAYNSHYMDASRFGPAFRRFWSDFHVL